MKTPPGWVVFSFSPWIGGLEPIAVQTLVAILIFALWGKNAYRIPHPLSVKTQSLSLF
jgi:hypothetical protein